MKRYWMAAVLVGVAALAFGAGSWLTWRSATVSPAGTTRQVLYYMCPMHPQYHSDRAGDCPSCGMRLEPVYADNPSAGSGQPMAPGAIQVSYEKQQLIGVRIGTVEAQSVEQAIRTVGRVAVDESRLYRLLAPSEGTVRQISDYSTGSIVRKNELLLSFLPSDPGYLASEQAFFYALDVLNGSTKTGLSEEQARLGLQNAIDALVKVGMSEMQIAAVAKARKQVTDVEVRSPVTGYVIERSVSAEQRLDRGVGLYEIADLARVWILLDLFENDTRDLRPGTRVRLLQPYAGSRPFEARVSNALPQFDAESRTMKIRLEAENADYSLRPGMFVDADIPVSRPGVLTVPIDAVVDSGVRKRVFVDRGNGYFEPRRVETGSRFGDRVEIVGGLKPGDRIVLSGTFLLDSESRMQEAALGVATPVRDPVCGMEIDQLKAKAAGRMATYRGDTYYFCSDDCKLKFETTPDKYVAKQSPVVAPDNRRLSPLANLKPIEAPGLESILGAGRMPMSGDVASRPGSAAVDGAPAGSQRPGTTPAAAADSSPAEHAGTHSMPKPGTTPAKADSMKPPSNTGPMQFGRVAPDSLDPRLAVVVTDPICGMNVDVKTATANGLKSEYKGTTYYFCSTSCKQQFDKAPEKYVKK
jgi:membrane fusion protein, copper/silver efflux system